jgi:hypothetical protein
MASFDTDILIAGGGVGGCAAALAAAEAGRRTILVEEASWIGGQLTSQAVPPDEHGWIEKFGCTASYRRFRDGVRSWYRRHYPLAWAAAQKEFLNPGNGWVSPLCHEPRVALAVLQEMLRLAESSGLLKILCRHRAVAAEVSPDGRVNEVSLLDLESGEVRSVKARYFLDATELGDLLPLTGTEYVTGSESRLETGEASAPEIVRPDNMQAFSVCFAMDYDPVKNHLIERPARYDFWRSYIPALSPPWPGPLLNWTGLNPRTMEKVRYRFVPHGEESRAFAGLWTYRRLLDRSNFAPGFLASDVCLVNWPMIDFLPDQIINCGREEKEARIREAAQLSLSAFYWLQTEAPRPDGGIGWPGLRLRPDITGTADGLAMQPYIRESRRIRALFTICEQHVAAEARAGEVYAMDFPDSVGVGYYRIDLHPSAGGDNYIDVGSLPFQIPLGALIPQGMLNLLPAAKNIGTTHITNGCYRVHPVEWNIGEAAGALASFCLCRGVPPVSVLENKGMLRDFQEALVRRGVELKWPGDLVLEEGDPHRHAM